MFFIRIMGRTALIALLFISPSWGGEPPTETRSAKPHVDLYGDALPPGAIARLGSVRFRQPGSVHAVAFSPDGKFIAASSDGLTKVILWERSSGRKLREFPGGGRPHPWALLRFSTYGEWLYGSLMHTRDKRMYAWDVETGATPKYMPPLPDGAIVLGFSPDTEEVILLNKKNEIVRWYIDGGKERGRYPKPDHDTGIAALLGDRLLVPRFDSQTIGMWDVAAKKKLWSAKMSRDKNWPVLPIAFSPDGKLFAFEAPPQGIMVHESVSGKLVRRLKADVETSYYSLAISPDARTVVGSNLDGSLRIWDLDSGQERVKPQPQAGWCRVFFTADSKTFATSGSHAVVLWHTATGKQVVPPRGQSWQISSVTFSPDGKMAATSSWPGGYPPVQLWDTQTNRPLRSFDAPSLSGALEVAFSPDGRTLAACGWTGLKQVWLWDIRTGRQLHALGGHENLCTCVAFSPDGKRLASGDRYYKRNGQHEGRLCLWDVASGKRLREIRSTRGAIERVLFTPDGRHILAAAEGVHIYDTETGRLVGQPFPAKTGIDSLALSGDGRLLATTRHSSGPVRLWELATRREISLVLPGGDSVAFSMDGRTLAVGRPKRDVLLFHWPSGKTVGRLSADFEARTRICFSPDSRKLATAWHPDSTALIWDVADLVNQPLPTVAEPTEADLRRWWAALRDDNPTEAYMAVWRFVAVSEQALPFVAAALPPIKPIEPAAVARLIEELDSDQFQVREKAAEELGRLGESVVGALQKVKNSRPSLEQRKRIERLLDEIAGPMPGPEQLRAIRAVVVLEQIGDAEARKTLAGLAAGAAGARRTEEAKAALERLKRVER